MPRSGEQPIVESSSHDGWNIGRPFEGRFGRLTRPDQNLLIVWEGSRAKDENGFYAYNAGDLVTAMWDGWLGPSAHATLFAAAVPYRETAGYVVAVREGSTLTRDLDAAVAP